MHATDDRCTCDCIDCTTRDPHPRHPVHEYDVFMSQLRAERDPLTPALALELAGAIEILRGERDPIGTIPIGELPESVLRAWWGDR